MINALKFLQVSLFTLLSIALIGCSSSSGGGGGSIGNGATPSLETSPQTSVSFGQTAQNHASTPLEVTISNNNSGNADLIVSSITVSDAVNFKLDSTKGSNPCLSDSPTINAGDNCTIEITFEPSQVDNFTATLDIESNDANSPKQLSLTGTGTTPVPSLQVSPLPSFDFGTITEGNSASPLEVTITNLGTAQSVVSSIALSDTINFQLDTSKGSNPCATPSPAVDEGDNCTVEISFTPPTTGTAIVYPATLTVVSNDASSPALLSLTGTSEPVAPTITVTINQVDVDLTNCPTDQTVTAFVSVTDQGDFPVEGLTLTDFDIQEDLGSAINPTTAPNVAMVTEPVSIALVMDNSSSLSDIDIAEMETQAIEIINMLGPSDAAEIIKFNKDVSVLQSFTTNKTDLITAIQTSFVGDGTALFDAIQLAVTDVSNQTTDRNVVIVITDGDDTQSVATSGDIITANTTNGIPIFAIAIGDDLSPATIAALQSITDATSAELYEAEVSQNLATIIQQQLSEVLFVDQYVLTYTSTSTGGGTVDLKVTATKTGPPLLTGFDTRDIARCP